MQLKTAYWELFEYPIVGANLMNQYVLESRRSMVQAGQSFTATNSINAAWESRHALDRFGTRADNAVSVDDAAPVVFSIHEGDYTSEWRWNVLRINRASQTSTMEYDFYALSRYHQPPRSCSQHP